MGAEDVMVTEYDDACLAEVERNALANRVGVRTSRFDWFRYLLPPHRPSSSFDTRLPTLASAKTLIPPTLALPRFLTSACHCPHLAVQGEGAKDHGVEERNTCSAEIDTPTGAQAHRIGHHDGCGSP